MANNTTESTNLSSNLWNISGFQTENPCQALSPTSVAITGKVWAYSILIPAALFGNILTILAIYTNKAMRRSLDFFIVNMAVSNLVLPSVVLPYQIVKTASNSTVWRVDGHAGEFVCKLVFLLADMSPTVSIFSLVGMTADRFSAVVCRSNQSTKISIRSRITMTWLFSLVLFLPYFYTFRLQRYNSNLYCLQRWGPPFDHVTAHRTYTTILLVAGIIIPFCLLTTMYAVILLTMSKCLPYYKPQSQAAIQRRCKAIRSTTVQALALVLVFGFCWGPYNVMILIWGFAWDWKPFSSCKLRLLFFIAQYMTYAYSCICPSVYFMFFAKYNRAMKRVLSCQIS